MFYIKVAVALALPVLVSASLPPCGNIDQPCSCPAGSTFKNITTYATIGATANDCGAVMNDYEAVRRFKSGTQMLTWSFAVFNTTWFGLVLLSTTGTDNVVGATRTFSISADNSVNLTEEVRDFCPVAMVLGDCYRLIPKRR